MDSAVMPFERDPTFVGRADILAQMKDSFDTKRRIVLVGEDFVGKTHITIEYLQQLSALHPPSHIFWCPANTPQEFDLGYKAIARQLSLPAQANTLQLICDWLEDDSHGPWLLVVDEADKHLLSPTTAGAMLEDGRKEGVVLTEYLPSKNKNGVTVFTTSDPEVAKTLAGEEGLVIEVPRLTPGECREVLHRKIPDESWSESESGKVVEALGYFPLAIRIAGAFITKNEITLPEYLGKFLALETDVKPDNNKTEYPPEKYSLLKVIRACKLSIDQIHSETPRAAELLFLMSALDGRSIPRTFLVHDYENPRDFTRALSTLQAFSLITPTPTNATFTMPLPLQIATQVWLSKRNLLQTHYSTALTLLAQAFPFGTSLGWPTCQALYGHAKLVLTYTPQSPTEHLARASLLRNIAEYHSTHGDYTQASTLLTEALAIQETHLTPTHEQTLLTANKQFELLRAQGLYQQAETLCRQTLARREEMLGREHPHTITSISNLAVILHDQSRYRDSEKLHRRALELNERVKGADDTDTLTSLNNLATLLSDQGRYADAEGLLRRSREGSMRVLGAGHVGTLMTVSNLAGVLDAQGRSGEAEAMNREVLARREVLLGEGHPDTLTSVSNLASILRKGGRYAEAEVLHRRALEGKERVLGSEHPVTLMSVNNLALVCTYQGKYAEAEELHRRSLEVQRKALGEEHLNTVTGMNNLAGLLGLQGKYEEAEQLHKKCLEVRRRLLGPMHRVTLGSMNNLAKVLLGQDRKLEEAEGLLRERLRLGAEMAEGVTQSSLMSRNNLGLVVAAQGKAEEAEGIHRMVLERRENLLGVNHPDTLTSAFNLANVLQEVGRYEEAKVLYERAYEGRKNGLGAEHPDTAAAEAAWSRMQEEMLQSKENVVRKEGPEPRDVPVKAEDLVLPVRNAESKK